MTERTRSRVQAAEMGFLRRAAGVSLRDRVRSSVIREELGVEPLLLCLEKEPVEDGQFFTNNDENFEDSKDVVHNFNKY
ncbi:hypothetical protein FVA96_24530 [Escherichia coli]|nr:hypothetical protein [Escherichia coli]